MLISNEQGSLISLNEGYSDHVREYIKKFENEEPNFILSDGLRRILLVSLIGGLTPEEMAKVLIWTTNPPVTKIYQKTFDSLTLKQQKVLLKKMVDVFNNENPFLNKYLKALNNNSGCDAKVFSINERHNYEKYMTYWKDKGLESLDIGIDVLFLSILFVRDKGGRKENLMNVGQYQIKDFKSQIENLDCSNFIGIKKMLTDYFEVPLEYTDIKSRILEFFNLS